MLPERTRHLDFGDVAAAWGMLDDLGVAAVIDEEPGRGRPGQPLSAGTYLALAALNRLVAPCSKAGLRGLVEDHGGGPVHQDPRLGAGSPPVLGRDARRHRWSSWSGSRRSRRGSCGLAGWTCRSVALDMTNFATFIDTGNGRAPIAQRGKAKQKRADLRLVGLGLVVTRDGGIPLTWHAYPGRQARRHPVPGDDRPAARPGTQAVCAAAGAGGRPRT